VRETKNDRKEKLVAEYVDGFVLVVPAENLAKYKKLAKMAAKVWIGHGALDYRECVSDDLDLGFGKSFTKLLKLKEGEVAVLAWITYKSKAQRNKVNAAVMKDPRMNEMCKADDMPFDMKRMSYGGFKTLVALSQ